MDLEATRAFLLEQQARYPEGRLQDLRKALHQSTFGCGHLVSDAQTAVEWIQREAAEMPLGRRESEGLDGPWCRISLGVLEEGLTAETLAAAFARSAAMPHEDVAALEARLAVLAELIEAGALPFDRAEATAEIALWRENGFEACRHSEAYRKAYYPAYRVLHRRYARLLPLLAAIDRKLAEKQTVLLAVEGGAGSGKSTLAALLAELYAGTCVLHADDFFLRPEQRTEDRYAQPGGNLDRERLEAEVLRPLSRGQTAVYRPFDCRTLSLREAVTVKPGRLNIVEGSYSFHPALALYYDLSVFLELSPETQRRRILKRNGPAWGQQFFDRWIPLEQAYFEGTDTAGRCALRLKEEADEMSAR